MQAKGRRWTLTLSLYMSRFLGQSSCLSGVSPTLTFIKKIAVCIYSNGQKVYIQFPFHDRFEVQPFPFLHLSAACASIVFTFAQSFNW